MNSYLPSQKYIWLWATENLTNDDLNQAMTSFPCSSYRKCPGPSGPLLAWWLRDTIQAQASFFLPFIGFYPEAFCPTVATELLESTHHVRIQDKKLEGAAPESHKPRLPLKPLACVHSPPLFYIVSITAKQFGRAGIFIWQFCLNYCVIIFLLEGPLVCSCKF